MPRESLTSWGPVWWRPVAPATGQVTAAGPVGLLPLAGDDLASIGNLRQTMAKPQWSPVLTTGTTPRAESQPEPWPFKPLYLHNSGAIFAGGRYWV